MSTSVDLYNSTVFIFNKIFDEHDCNEFNILSDLTSFFIINIINNVIENNVFLIKEFI